MLGPVRFAAQLEREMQAGRIRQTWEDGEELWEACPAAVAGRGVQACWGGSHSGIALFMRESNIGTVKAVCPWAGLQIIPFLISPLRRGPACCTLIPRASAMSPERWGPDPRNAIALTGNPGIGLIIGLSLLRWLLQR